MLLSVGSVAQSVRSGETSAAKTMEEVLARISAYDAIQPQAWISRPSDADLLTAAARVDALLAAGVDLPLAGVPFAVKDNIDVAGMPTTAACPDFAYTPDSSATAVARLEEAGAICVGKTNLDQFATGLNGTRSPFGIPACVFNSSMVSGGSSSGSAVVVAAGLVPFALGTDTAGSGRVPAAINGCIGFKPSKGRWSTAGLVPACRTIDCISVFTADIEGAALVHGVVDGLDANDPYSRSGAELPTVGDSPRIGVPLPGQREFYCDEVAAQLFAAACDRLRAMGAEIVELDIAPLLEAGAALYGGPYVAERFAAVGEFLQANPDAGHPVVATIVAGGAKYSAADYFKAAYRMRELQGQAAAMWREVDALVLPTSPTCYSIEAMLAEPFGLNARLGHYTTAINLLDMCAVAVPAGYRPDNTGFGVSLIGPAFADAAMLSLAERYMQAGAPIAPALDLTPRDRVEVAVVGAHLEGMPLHWQLADRGARLVAKSRTAPCYRLYAIANSVPPKPALVHVAQGGVSIEIEIYALDEAAFGSFTAEVPPPLAIGTLSLEDGTQVKGFVAEARATCGATDISHLGSWRNYIASLG